MDNLNPNLVWYIGAGLCILAAFGFFLLHLKIGRSTRLNLFTATSDNK